MLNSQTTDQINQIMQTFFRVKAQVDAKKTNPHQPQPQTQAPQQFIMTQPMLRFQNQLKRYQQDILEYEYPDWHEAALAHIPVDKLVERANKCIDEPPIGTKPLSFKDELLKQLLAWFKHEFFKWVNQPDCDFCGSATQGIGGTQPNSSEIPFRPGHVELYRCNTCRQVTRFPRYNDPKKLLETRRGRCGEWAQCFTLCARALGYEVRLAHDWTDHIWTEVYSDSQERWLHCDSCENSMDAPLLYEAGWGKKLNWVIAVSANEVVDVTQRYTHKYSEVLTRRHSIPENWLEGVIAKMNAELHPHLSPQVQASLAKRKPVEEAEFKINREGGKKKEEVKEEEKDGRISGSVEWRAQRGELGDFTKTLEAEEKQKEVKKELEELDKKIPQGGACTVAPFERADPPQVKKPE